MREEWGGVGRKLANLQISKRKEKAALEVRGITVEEKVEAGSKQKAGRLVTGCHVFQNHIC